MREKDEINFHICQDSNSSKSETDDSCKCPPEYYCAYICGEDYSIRSDISWQHFPRSTSSPSRCEDSSVESLQKSISDSTIVPCKEEERRSESKKSSTSEYPITKSFAQLKAQHYLQIRHIFEFLNFLISHLVCNEPDDPIRFLVNLLEKCLKYRDSFGEPPLLFTHNHVKSLYDAFDPFERGHLTLQQYEEAMRSLGLENSITPYNTTPSLNEEGFVEESFFIFESNRCLIENLKQMLKIPKMWEENRLTWKKRMEKRAAQHQERSSFTCEENGEEIGEIEQTQCRCDRQPKNNCQCSYNLNNKCELEQLFLD